MTKLLPGLPIFMLVICQLSFSEELCVFVPVGDDANSEIYRISENLCLAAKKGPKKYSLKTLEYWSDQGVYVAHEPAAKGDGLVGLDMITQHEDSKGAYYDRFDELYNQDVYARVVSDFIYLFYAQVSTKKDGTNARINMATKIKIEKGKIISLTLSMD